MGTKQSTMKFLTGFLFLVCLIKATPGTTTTTPTTTTSIPPTTTITTTIKECDLVDNTTTFCQQGDKSCKRYLLAHTNTDTECQTLCKNREACLHYVWCKPGNKWANECWVLEGGQVTWYQNSNCISGSCNKV